MLDKNTPADFISINYPYSGNTVRFHKNSDDSSLWLVLTDICAILGLSNVSYTASKLDKNNVHKHKVHTDGGVQTVTWIRASDAIRLATEENNEQLLEFLRDMAYRLRNINRPDIIEKEQFLKLMSVFDEISHSNYII